MSFRRGKMPYNPFVSNDTSFDAEEAMQVAPKALRTTLECFKDYSNSEFKSLIHHAIVMGSHSVTDALCNKYPEESFHKLSRWAYNYAYTGVRKHLAERVEKENTVLAQ